MSEWGCFRVLLRSLFLSCLFLPFFLSLPAGPDSDCEKEAITVILYTYAASIVTWTVSITIFLTILEG